MLLFWIIFNAAMIVLVLIDLATINRGGRVIPFREALFSTAIWIILALGFSGLIHQWLGAARALEFVTGYLIEEALSVDNLFVFILLFSYFKVPPDQERTVLFWGILGALLMRGVFILAGVALVRRFEWILYALGAFLVYSGLRLMRGGAQEQVDPSRNLVLRVVRRFLPVSSNFAGHRFFTVQEGRRFATPLFVVLLVVETTDILFATDSIPAILAISRHPFIVYTSNIFAVLGLRSMFFALSGLMKLFHHLHYGLAVVLMFIGAKMLIEFKYQIPTWVVLTVIATVLAISIAASIWTPKKDPENE